MASNYTTNYNLCQWQPTDAVQRVDFNADNAKLDTALKSLSDQVVQKANQSALNTLISAVNRKADQSALDSLTQTVSQKASQSALDAVIAAIPKVAAGTYIGDGTQNRKISLSFTPKAVYVTPQNGSTYYLDSELWRRHSGGLAVQGSPLTWMEYTEEEVRFLEVTTNGFLVWSHSYYGYQVYFSDTNNKDCVYHYLAIG